METRLFKHPYALALPALALSVLSACVAPDQRFDVGSEPWRLANPEFRGDHAPNADRFKVKVGVIDAGFDYNAPLLRHHIVVSEAPAASGRTYGIGLDVLGDDFFPHYRVLNVKRASGAGSEITEIKDVSEDLSVNEHGTHVAQLVTLNDREIGLIPVRALPLGERTADKVGLPADLPKGKNPAYQARLAHRMVDAIARGIEFAYGRGARVINMSLGLNLGDLTAEGRKDVLNHARTLLGARISGEWKDCLMVAASGNESERLHATTQVLPATLDSPEILTVGALSDKDKNIAYYNNYGRYVDLYVRGTDIMSAVPNDAWGVADDAQGEESKRTKMSGTSMAAPLVAHAAAQVKAIDPSLSASELRALLLNTALAKTVPFEGHEKYLRPTPQPIRILDMKAARDRARWLLVNPGERSAWLTAPYLHGRAPVAEGLLR